jgi:hypothetical protein
LIQKKTSSTTLRSSNPVGWGIKELRYGFGDGPIKNSELNTVREFAEWIAIEYPNGKKGGN